MPLVSMRQLLDHAAENSYGIPAFNVNNLEQVQAVMMAADEAGAPVVVWHIKEAIPVKLGAPSFEAASNQVAIETLELLVTSISVEHV